MPMQEEKPTAKVSAAAEVEVGKEATAATVGYVTGSPSAAGIVHMSWLNSQDVSHCGRDGATAAAPPAAAEAASSALPQSKRRRKTAAERRAQQARADARMAARLLRLAGLVHRGHRCRLGSQLAALLAPGAPSAAAIPALTSASKAAPEATTSEPATATHKQ